MKDSLIKIAAKMDKETQKLIKDVQKIMKNVDEDYFDEVFDDVDLDGEIDGDDANVTTSSSFVAKNFKNAMEMIIDADMPNGTHKKMFPFVEEIIKPWIGKRMEIKGYLGDKDKEVTVVIVPKSLKYNKSRDTLEITRFDVKRSSWD